MEEMDERFACGDCIRLIKRDAQCRVYRVRDLSGEGTMTLYPVFPGVDLLFNDFHIASCHSEFKPYVDMIGIDHCREGRIEWELEDGGFMYIREGDLQINAKDKNILDFGFPLKHYRGITIAVYVEEASAFLPRVMDGFSVDLQALREKLCSGRKPFVVRSENTINQVFSDLYTVPEAIRSDYFKVKVLELLLILSVLDQPPRDDVRSYFPKCQVDTVKAIMAHITEHVDCHYTLEELARSFGIGLTTMKTCFKGVYGTSIYAFIREYRMQAAARMLRDGKETVSVIAGKVGYDNASKFAKAFKETLQVSPQEYRRTYGGHFPVF